MLIVLLVSGMHLEGCAVQRGVPARERPPVQERENLNGVLWMQTAAEYQMVAHQTYTLARLMLDRALEDSSWTASVEQAREPAEAYDDRPPAVILDVDETVLDNTAYQAWLIQTGRSYSSRTWQQWVEQEQAVPVPGARAFTLYAARRGVQLFFVTNRAHGVEAATRRNLEAYGFPVSGEEDVLLTEGERPDWTSDKTSRRQYVAGDYRILLLVGDNLGDFVGRADTSAAARRKLARTYERYWGTRWLVLPNPLYGSWEAALYGFDYGLHRSERLDRKYEQLRSRHAPVGDGQ